MEDSVYRVTAKALIFDNEMRVLMVNYAAGLWGLPGGGIEHGEDPQTALIRECQEELGITVSNVSATPVFVGTEDLTSSVWSCKLLYRADWNDKPGFVLEKGIIDAQYLSVDDLENKALVGSGTYALEYLRSL